MHFDYFFNLYVVVFCVLVLGEQRLYHSNQDNIVMIRDTHSPLFFPQRRHNMKINVASRLRTPLARWQIRLMS